MSFREKTSWISLLSMAGIYGFYFWNVIQQGHQAGGLEFGGLMMTIVALVIVQVVLITAAAIAAPKAEVRAPRDERERLIDFRSSHIAYAALATSVAMACFFAAMDPPIVFGTNALLFILVSAEILRCAFRIIQYRRAG